MDGQPESIGWIPSTCDTGEETRKEACKVPSDHGLSPSPAMPLTPRPGAALAHGPDASRKRSIGAVAEDGRQKRKVTRACDICKAKKAKCSGTQPCESCARRGLSCLYESRYSRGKPPTPPQNDQASSPSLAAPGHPRRFVSVNVSRPQAADTTSLAAPSPVTPRDAQQSLPNHSGESGIAHEAPSRASPELEVAGHYADSTSVLSFLHRAWRRLPNNQNSQILQGPVGSHDENQLLTSAGDKPFEAQGKVQIPPLPQSRELMAMYFDVCIATYRMLHRPTVEGWLETVVRNAEVSDPRPIWYGLGQAKAAIVLAILAVASFHEEKARGGTTEPGHLTPEHGEGSLRLCDGLFCEAAQLTQGETGFPKLASAQARLIQVLYLLMTSRANQAWYTFGHTLQIISALGLHRRDDRWRKPQRQDYIEEQCRKRTFWVAYALDKYLGAVFGRPRHYHDDDIDQELPDSINDEDMTPDGPTYAGTDDCHIKSLIYHAKLAQIAERISREVYSIKPIPDQERIAASHRLGTELRQWKASLPPFLGAINPSSLITSFRRQAIALRLSYCHAVMLAHRPFLLRSIARDSQETQALAKESINECITAAQSVLECVDRMAHDGRLFHAFWWTHYVCFCALVVIYVWAIQQSNSVNDERSYVKMIDQAERCLSHLAQATATNSPSRRYSIILQELRAEAKKRTARRLPELLDPIMSHPSCSNVPVVPSPSTASEPAPAHWEPIFGSTINSTASAVPSFLDGWQTTDWLDLDSSAFGPFPAFIDGTTDWSSDLTR